MSAVDEQRFRARLDALAAAVRWSSSNVPGVLQAAETFERWLLRPAPVDVPGAGTAAPGKQPCGAFLQPDWFVDGTWAVCKGTHVKEDDEGAWLHTIGWHRGAGGIVFATHHAVQGSSPRCACGGPIPCGRKPMDP